MNKPLHDHTTQSGPIYSGPYTAKQFLQQLERSYETGVRFANRDLSNHTANQLSYLSKGWIIAATSEFGVLLYDSVQNPTAYMSRLPGHCWVAGRHELDQYWIQSTAKL